MERFDVRVILLLLLFPVAGCRDPAGVEDTLEYPDAVRFSDDAALEPVWNQLESCSGLRRDFHAVSFYSVPRFSLSNAPTGELAVGQYNPRTNRIFIISEEIGNRAVFRHEMMHALLGHRPGHPSRYFDGVCGKL